MVETEGATNNVRIWRTYAHAHAHASGYPHARTHARTHAYTHRPVSNTYCFSTAAMIREGALLLRDTYIACIDYFYSVILSSNFYADVPV